MPKGGSKTRISDRFFEKHSKYLKKQDVGETYSVGTNFQGTTTTLNVDTTSLPELINIAKKARKVKKNLETPSTDCQFRLQNRSPEIQHHAFQTIGRMKNNNFKKSSVSVEYDKERDLTKIKFRYLDKSGYIRWAAITIKGRVTKTKARKAILDLLYGNQK